MQAQPFRTPRLHVSTLLCYQFWRAYRQIFLRIFAWVTVRREQIKTILAALAEVAIPRVVLLGNLAYCSDNLLAMLGRSRAVLAFPGMQGMPTAA